ncbi:MULTISPECIES: N-acetylmuramoyl-L-alanine amidase family protein [Pelosinus]|nr:MULTISPECIES: N-acetylmuramoyl-L-alanine amidase [Pelosinus]
MIIIDPGHAGPTKDPGAVGPGGTFESDRALEIGLKVKAGLMRLNIPVTMTREMYDQPVTDDLSYRTDLANNYAAAAFISIHCNAAESPTAVGCEIWTTPGQTGADSLAEAVLGEFEKQMPGLYLRKDTSDGDGDKEARFYVLKYTDAPAILIETGFISNPEEEALLATDAYQQQVAQVIIDGLVAWLKEG